MLRFIISFLLLMPSLALAAVTVSVNGTNHTIPQTNERGWGTNVTAWIQAISQYTLQPTGGTFTLGADVDFGATYGLKSAYFKSRGSNLSSAGILRLANAETIGWRNNANSGNLLLTVNSSDQLTYNGVVLASSTGPLFQDSLFSLFDDGDATKLLQFQLSGITTGTTRTITVPDANVNLGALTNSNIDASAAIAYSKLALSDSILNADINSSAAIARSKLASGTANHVVINSAGGAFSSEAQLATSRGGTGQDFSASTGVLQVSSGTVSATTVNLTSQVSGALPIANGGTGQTAQTAAFDALAPTTTKGDLIVSDGSDNVRVAAGTNDYVLTADSAQTAGVKWAAPAAAPAQSYELSNVGLATSVGSSALTIALKQSDGSTDCSSGSSACKIGFRSSTLTSGAFNQRSVTSSLSLVVSSGSTLGHASGVTHYIYVYAIDNAGTVELAASTAIYDDGALVSTTAEGGGGAADSNSAIYSTTARSNVPVRMIGRLTTSQTTAGTWASAPTAVALVPFLHQDVFARYDTNAGQSVASSAVDIINFEDKSIDSHNAVTTGASWKFTSPVKRVCKIDVTVNFGGNPMTAEAAVTLELYKNGSLYSYLSQYRLPGSAAGASQHITGSDIVSVDVGDYIDIRMGNGEDSSQGFTGFAGYNYVNIYCSANALVP